MYSDENKSSSLAKFLNGFDYAMIDTCSLMDEAFPEWMDALHNAKEYRKKGQEILVPRRCYDELKKHARQHRDDSKRINARRGLKILRKAKRHHLLAITKKDKTENFADNAIYVKVCADRLFSKILVITQDKSLASDLRALNLLKSQSGRPLEVHKLISGGRLVPNKGEEDNPNRERNKGHYVYPDVHKIQIGAAPTVDAVLASDARLSAVINNSNYPEEKKRADALAQLKQLDKINESTKAQLSLLVPIPKLKEIAGLTKPKPEPKALEKKPEPEKKPEKKPEQPAKLWYGTGKTMQDAFKECGEHYGLIFRDPSVIYFEKGHGPLDLTTKDLEAIEAMATPLLRGEEKISFVYRGMTLLTLKTPEKFKAWIDVNALPKALGPMPKPPKADKPAEAKPKAKPAKKAEAKPEAKPTEAVGEEPKKPVRKKPAKKEETTQKTEEKPAKPVKKEAKPKAEKPAEEAKPSAKKPAKPKKETAPKTEEKPTPEKAKPAKAKKAEPKVKEETDKPADPAFEKAKKADRRLRAVLPNPNYALEDKLKDLEAQKKLLSTLKPEQISALKYGPEAIDAWIESNGK